MTGIATIEDATAALELHAKLEGQALTIGVRRNAGIARVNAAADKLATPLLEQMAALRKQLEPWWEANAATLLKGKNKSVQLGGCIIGSKAGAASLALKGGDFDGEAEKLRKLAWATPYVRVTVSIDKAAVRKALDGPDGAKLKRRGFGEQPGTDAFFVNRVAQAATVTTSN